MKKNSFNLIMAFLFSMFFMIGSAAFIIAISLVEDRNIQTAISAIVVVIASALLFRNAISEYHKTNKKAD